MMISLNRNIDQLKKIISSDILINESMRDHTSFRIGGPADIFIIPNSVEDLINVVHYSRDNDLPLYTIGKGTNLLVSDRGIRGIVVKIGGVLDHLELFEDKLRVSAGAHLPSLSRFAARNGLSGLEFGIGIPGTVGER